MRKIASICYGHTSWRNDLFRFTFHLSHWAISLFNSILPKYHQRNSADLWIARRVAFDIVASPHRHELFSSLSSVHWLFYVSSLLKFARYWLISTFMDILFSNFWRWTICINCGSPKINLCRVVAPHRIASRLRFTDQMLNVCADWGDTASVTWSLLQ